MSGKTLWIRRSLVSVQANFLCPSNQVFKAREKQIESLKRPLKGTFGFLKEKLSLLACGVLRFIMSAMSVGVRGKAFDRNEFCGKHGVKDRWNTAIMIGV